MDAKNLIVKKAWLPIASYEQCGDIEAFNFLGFRIYERIGNLRKYLGVITIEKLDN